MKLRIIAAPLLFGLCACVNNNGGETDNENNVLEKFNSTWNIYEKLTSNDDGSITYNALPWGGLVGTFTERNMPVDLSGYESITFVFSQPTTFVTQVVVADKMMKWGKEGISSLTCNFYGDEIKSVDEIVLQASDTCSITIKDIYLVPNNASWESTMVWEGKCVFGNWAEGFIVGPEKFDDVVEGDKLEFEYETDTSDPGLTYWLFKTIYSGTESTLEGNDSELNSYGCAFVGKNSTRYRITLTETDIENLREKGLFVNGYYNVVKRCNILKRYYPSEE